MSFWPLATSLVERLRADGRHQPLIELGSGRGDFGRRLRSLGIATWGLDLRREGSAVDICADALELPFRDRSLGAMAAGNLLRHLSPQARSRFAAETARCAADGGLLLLCEDSPVARDEAERNYRIALELLAEFDPSRGAAISVEEHVELVRRSWPRLLESGSRENAERVGDPMAPLRWLFAQTTLSASLRRRCEQLAERIALSGMSYGLYEYGLFAVRP